MVTPKWLHSHRPPGPGQVSQDHSPLETAPANASLRPSEVVGEVSWLETSLTSVSAQPET